MTVDELSYAILTKLDRNTDEGLLNTIKLSVQGKWALLVRREIRQYGDSTIYEQTIRMPLTFGQIDVQCGLPIIDDCPILKSETILPPYLSLQGRQPYKIHTLDRKITIDFMQPEQMIYAVHNKYTGNNFWYSISNQYLYIYNTTLLENVLVTFIPDTPDATEEFDCITCETKPIIPSWMEDSITKMVIQDLNILQPDNKKEQIDNEQT